MQMAENRKTIEYEQPNEVHSQTTMATASVIPSSSLSTLSSTPMAQNRNIDYDAIETAPSNANMALQALHWENQKSQRKVEFDIDSGSHSSKDNKCEDCLINCLYYTHECCDCAIL